MVLKGVNELVMVISLQFSHLHFFVVKLISAIQHNVSPSSLGLFKNGSLVNTIKTKVVALATNSGVLKTVSRPALLSELRFCFLIKHPLFHSN